MKNKKRKLIWWIIGIILLLGIIAITYYYFSKFQDNTQNETIEIKEIVKPNQLEIKKMYFGDVFWGRSINDWAQASELKEKYPFSGLSTFNRENYQAWIGSLNCPITDRQI
ncbi:MAG: hypothetical protein PHW50_02940, partial [Patescibacteria group bacterium]|nr:hypothetical protein [Patescibacteria group bacterium]